MVWVFKTSVESDIQVSQLLQALDSLVLPGGKWSFDLEDCDRILRIEAPGLDVERLIVVLQNTGFQCEELQD